MCVSSSKLAYFGKLYCIPGINFCIRPTLENATKSVVSNPDSTLYLCVRKSTCLGIFSRMLGVNFSIHASHSIARKRAFVLLVQNAVSMLSSAVQKRVREFLALHVELPDVYKTHDGAMVNREGGSACTPSAAIARTQSSSPAQTADRSWYASPCSNISTSWTIFRCPLGLLLASPVSLERNRECTARAVPCLPSLDTRVGADATKKP